MPESEGLMFDVRRDLERVDQVMTQVIRDPATSAEFVRDPSGVLSRLGLHPPASRQTHDRVNRIFYAVMNNAELVRILEEHYSAPEFQTAAADALEEHNAVFLEGLTQGELRSNIEYDIVAANHAFSSPDFLRRAYRVTLYDLNERGLLQNVYPAERIDEHIESMIESIRRGLPIRQHSKLEVWEDPYYGVGTGYAVGEVESPVVATSEGGVQIAFIATTFIPVWGAQHPDPETVSRAMHGEPGAVRMMATLGALSNLAGQVLLHANTFAR